MLEVVVTADMEEPVGEVTAVVVMEDTAVVVEEGEVMAAAEEVTAVVVMADTVGEVMVVVADLMVVGDMVEAMEEEDTVGEGGMEEALEGAQQLWSSKLPMNAPF